MLRESAEISAVRYTNLNGIVYEYDIKKKLTTIKKCSFNPVWGAKWINMTKKLQYMYNAVLIPEILVKSLVKTLVNSISLNL